MAKFHDVDKFWKSFEMPVFGREIKYYDVIVYV
jgi:hypothetical protein